MTAAATWDPCYCQAVSPWSVTSPPCCRRQKWQVISVFPCMPAAATQVAWITVLVGGHMIHSTPHTLVVRCRAWQRRPAEQLHRWTITAGENCRLRLDRSSSERVPGNLFPSREIYFPGINKPRIDRVCCCSLVSWRSQSCWKTNVRCVLSSSFVLTTFSTTVSVVRQSIWSQRAFSLPMYVTLLSTMMEHACDR